MLVYWLMFAFPAVMALLEARGGAYRAQPTFGWVIVVIALFAIIGLRWQTGGDWGNYDRMVQSALWDRAGINLLGDPGFAALTRLAAGSQYGMLVVTMASALVIGILLVVFCLQQPRPWLCLTVAVPYFVIVMGMGYIRQGMAVSCFLMALLAARRVQPLGFLAWIFGAALFHSTALILAPLAVFIARTSVALRVLAFLLAAAGVYFIAISTRTEALITNYVDEEMTSSGALVRLAMTAVPGAILLIWWQRFQLTDSERWVWLSLAIAGIVAFGLVLIFPASTAIDRLGLYLLPLQCFVYAAMPDALAGNERTARVLTVAIVGLYAAALFVWLNYAVNVEYWLPYRFFLLEDGICLEC